MNSKFKVNKKLTIDVSKDYLEKAYDFALRYHLSEVKMKRDRTTGKHRNLGGIMDAFVSGKVVELGVMDILKNMNKHKEYCPDLVVKNDQDFSEPDIITIIDSNNPEGRLPQIFIEIKTDPENYGWAGLYKEQFDSIKSNPIVNSNLKKIFIIFAQIVPKKSDVSKERNDLLGTYLKLKQKKNKELSTFLNPSDYSIVIQFVMTGKELEDSGRSFNKKDKKNNVEADYMFEPEIINSLKIDAYNDDGTVRKGYVHKEIIDGKLPTENLKKYPKQLDEGFTINGNVEIFTHKRFTSSIYIKSESSFTLKNKFLGGFSGKNGNYSLNFNSTQ